MGRQGELGADEEGSVRTELGDAGKPRLNVLLHNISVTSIIQLTKPCRSVGTAGPKYDSVTLGQRTQKGGNTEDTTLRNYSIKIFHQKCRISNSIEGTDPQDRGV